METPFISVILPVYNAEKYIVEAIKSILNQTYKNFELLVINDGSTDTTHQLISEIKDKRISIIENEKNLGLIATLNKGISIAKGELIARMDADDISLPNRFESQVNFLIENKSVDILGCSYEMFGDINKTIQVISNKKKLAIALLFKNAVMHPTVMFRKKSIIENELQYDPNYLHIEDWAFWLSAIKKGLIIANIDEVQLKYRFEGQNITVINKEKSQERYKNIYQNYLPKLLKDELRPFIIDEKIINIHLAIAEGKAENFSNKEFNTHFSNLKKALLINGHQKQQVKEVLNEKKKNLLYSIADKSKKQAILFLIQNKIYKKGFLKYFLATLKKQ